MSICNHKAEKDQVHIIEESDLFNSVWYQKIYLGNDKKEPAAYYLTQGWKEGHDPSPDFSTKEYLCHYSDVEKSGINPLLHYELYGKKENRIVTVSCYKIVRDSCYFDAEWYAQTYLTSKNQDPIQHYLEHGTEEGIDPSPIFSSKEYYLANSDVQKAGMNPLIHFEIFGFQENREMILYRLLLERTAPALQLNSHPRQHQKDGNNQPEIKIFVSCRNESVVPENPLFFPIQFGTSVSKSKIQGSLWDNTGDNISEREKSYDELTAQYWVWKNSRAEFVGFFQSNRYLSFTTRLLKESVNLGVRFETPDTNAVDELSLHECAMRTLIEQYDLILPKAHDWINVKKLGTNRTVYAQFASVCNVRFLNRAVEIVKRLTPDFSDAVDYYLNSSKGYSHNVYLMKWEYFNAYCAWLFPILDELYAVEEIRNENHTVSIIAERLFGIYLTHLVLSNPDLRVLETQISIFDDVCLLKHEEPTQNLDIKIFVSHRIDLQSVQIENPLFFPVRCGAVFDDSKSEIAGDNTGDNISEKRMTFCELTVQYWAWKNVEADYYGLCHYRRYLSFSNKQFPETWVPPFVVVPYISKTGIAKYGLTENEMRKVISQYDVITIRETSIKDFGTNIWGHYAQFTTVFNMQDTTLLRDIIAERYPEYVEDSNDYFDGDMHRGYNCFIMKREVYDRYCKFLFNILFEFEKRIDTTHYSAQKNRAPGYMSEHLYAIFYLHIFREQKLRFKELQPVFFEHTEIQSDYLPVHEQGNVPVVFTCSNEYVPFLQVCIQSILNHAESGNYYDLIILQNNINDKNQRALKNWILTKPNASIRFYDPGYLLGDVSSGTGHASLLIYCLMTPYILKNYDKAIVLDCDTIVNSNLADLFNEDLGDCYVGAIRDIVALGQLNDINFGLLRYLSDHLKMKDPYDTVNTGVMVMNLKAIRERFDRDYILHFATAVNYSFPCRDVVNILFEGRIKFLSPVWNVFTQSNSMVEFLLNAAPEEFHCAYQKASRQPRLVHYSGSLKPWHDAGMDQADLFWSVAKTVPMYEVILQTMMDLKIGSVNEQIRHFVNVKNYELDEKALNRTQSLQQQSSMKRILKGLLRKIYHGFQKVVHLSYHRQERVN